MKKLIPIILVVAFVLVALPCVAQQLDIKPGSDPNSINLKSKGVVPVAVLGDVSFDVAIIDPATVVFAGASPLRWAMEDVNGDGYMDMVFHFKTQKLQLQESDTTATLSGQTKDGNNFSCFDSVRIVHGR